MLLVDKISRPDELDAAMSIRNMVFVDEQHVPADMEHDEYDAFARHFLARIDGRPCGTARWRKTEEGIKLERFAVLKDFRKKGVGSALVAAVLKDIRAFPDLAGKPIYMHSQADAVLFYEKFGFVKSGPQFEECGIKHYKMTLSE